MNSTLTASMPLSPVPRPYAPASPRKTTLISPRLIPCSRCLDSARVLACTAPPNYPVDPVIADPYRQGPQASRVYIVLLVPFVSSSPRSLILYNSYP